MAPGHHTSQGELLAEYNDQKEFDVGGLMGGHHEKTWRRMPSVNAPRQTDPVEAAFSTMARNLEEKESAVAELKLQLEAIVTAIAVGGQGERGLEDALANTKMDITEVAHRIVVRLKSLKEENDALGVSVQVMIPVD